MEIRNISEDHNITMALKCQQYTLLMHIMCTYDSPSLLY